MVLRSLQHDLGRAKRIAAMNHGHFTGEARQKKCFLHGRVPAPDHHDFLSRKKETITGRTRRNSVPDELLLMRQTQPTRGRPTGNNQSLGVDLMNAQMQQKRTLAEIGTGQMRHSIFGAEAFGLLPHVFDQLRTQNAFGKSGKVLDQGGQRKLSARLVPFDDKRLQVSPRRVEGGSVSGASGSDDDHVSSFAHE